MEQGLAKKPRHATPSEPTQITLFGDDDALSSDELQQWRSIVDNCHFGQQWIDQSFPAHDRSITGKTASEPKAKPTPSAAQAIPRCSCGVEAVKATVTRDTANKGRSYWHCGSRKCGMFGWVDGGAGSWQKRGKSLKWARMPQQLEVVSDFGFRAMDLRQGAVGDCWFMSALAVVAERHDLIAKLFAADTARNPSGCYSLRLFLDGKWKSVLLDDLLPVTAEPRRGALAFDTKLAFCRTSGPNGEQQLWVSAQDAMHVDLPFTHSLCWFRHQWWRKLTPRRTVRTKRSAAGKWQRHCST